MCQECGCGLPAPTRIDGKPADDVHSPLVDGESDGHAHPHRHEHEHPHSHPHEHTHLEGTEPWHSHSHPHIHTHEHMHDTGHEHDHEHEHEPPHDHAHEHTHAHTHEHSHGEDPPVRREVAVHESLFAANDRFAERNRGFFRALEILVLNVVSSPGSGKTTLFTETIAQLRATTRVGVVVGDLETDNDARRLRATGAPVVQITTGTLCHLDAQMVARAVGSLDLRALDLLVIENVGNLVCPASFDLGENLRLALLSVTEGEDKPLKYPPLFRTADVILVTKTDLAPHVDFNRELALANIRRVSPKARLFEVSAKTGEGMEAWCNYLKEARARIQRLPTP
ncbi:MAG TPA: hydrogenase nickel incorporation protein HypB [Candidatus Baltobacteraceae bacterium]|nr:hydrogenase nickel incorporation protein HypB [Candidatus Baltobacteraceae bacterium]